MSLEVFGFEPEEGQEAEPDEITPVEQMGAPEEPPQEQEAPPAEQEELPEAAAPPDTDDEDEELATDADGFRIGGKVYQSLESADRTFKRTVGRLKKTDAENNKLSQENARLLAVIEGLSKQAPQQPPPPVAPSHEPPAKPQRLSDAVDDDEIEQIIANEGPGKAFRKILELAEARMHSIVDEKTAPAQELVNASRWEQETLKLFDSVFAQADESGGRLFPELDIDSDPETAKAVFEIWKRNAADPESSHLALKPRSVAAAVYEYRGTRPAPAPVQPAPPPPRPRVVLEARAADRSLMGMSSSSGSVRPGVVGKPGNGEAEEAWLRRQATDHPVFGITG